MCVSNLLPEHESVTFTFQVQSLNHNIMAMEGVKGKGSPYSMTERRVPELIPVLGSQPAGDVSHKPSSRLPLLSVRPAVTLATLRGLLPTLLLHEQRHDRCEQFA